MARLEGKVALVTGAARGQGRSHAVRMAEEGADIIAVDICRQIESVNYPLATPDDLVHTAKLVEELDRRVVTFETDVRDEVGLSSAVAAGVSALGRLDIVCANAGVCPLGPEVPVQGFVDTLAVNFVGVLNTVAASLPHLTSGASIVITGSVAGLMSAASAGGAGLGGLGGGGAAYAYAKQTLVTYTKQLAIQLAPQMMRVNCVHPTNCNTDMLQSDPMYRTFRPDLENPTREDAEVAFPAMQSMPIPWVEPVDISHAVVFLASDEARYITGQQLAVDGGGLLKL